MNKEQIRAYLGALGFTEGLGDEYPAYDFVDIDFDEHVRIEMSESYPYECIGVGPDFKNRLQNVLTEVEKLIPILARIREAEQELDPIATPENVKEFLDRVRVPYTITPYGEVWVTDHTVAWRFEARQRLSWYKQWVKEVLTSRLDAAQKRCAVVRRQAEEELQGIRDILDKPTAEGV